MDYSSWYRYTIFGLLVIVVVLILAKFVKRIRKLTAAKRQAYRESEAYWYDQIKKQTNASGLLNALYQWLDHAKEGPKTLSSLTEDHPDFAQVLEDLQKAQFQGQTDEVFDKNQIKALLAACYAQLGRDREARQALSEFLSTAHQEIAAFPGEDPDLWRRYWARHFPFENSKDLDHLLDGLRKAGLPA